MTLTIVEGVDGAGKSTLIDRLNKTESIHCGPLKRNPLDEYIMSLSHYDGGQDIVCDRLHVGELVYGPIYRGESKLTEQMRRYVEMFLESRGAVKITLDAPLHEIARRLELRGEDFLQPEDLERVWRFYRHYGSDNGWLVLDNPDVDVVHSVALSAQERVADLLMFPRYVGNVEPDVLFVVHTNQTPFPLMPYAESPGEMFFASIPDGVRVGVTSADTDLSLLWETLRFPRVITLGTVALARSRASDLKVRQSVPHPQEIFKQSPSTWNAYASTIMKGITRG